MPKERYLLRWTTYKELKRNGLEQTKIQRLKDGTYKTYAHFERKGKYFMRITKWKFLNADKKYSIVTKSWDERSYQKVLKRELKKFKESKRQEFTAGVQKFTGRIISARSRKIQGRISKVHYLNPIKKKTKQRGLDIYGTNINILLSQTESMHTFLSGEFIKRKRKKGKKNVKRNKNVKHRKNIQRHRQNKTHSHKRRSLQKTKNRYNT